MAQDVPRDPLIARRRRNVVAEQRRSPWRRYPEPKTRTLTSSSKTVRSPIRGRAERALALQNAIQLGYDGGPLPDHEQLIGGPVVDPRRTDPGHLRLSSGAGKDAPTVASTGAGGVVTTAGFRASCCWLQSSATSCTPPGSRHRNDGSLVNNRSAIATPTAPNAA